MTDLTIDPNQPVTEVEDWRRVDRPTLRAAHRFFDIVNDLLLLPLTGLIIIEVFYPSAEPSGFAKGAGYTLFCIPFFLEWLIGLFLAREVRAYLTSPVRIVELLSSLPVGLLSGSARLIRLVRFVRLIRVLSHVGRLRRSSSIFLRVSAIVGSTVLAGAMAIEAVEPESVPSFPDALWWSIVTLSTVGYGDIYPATPAGRLVAAALITFGIGVFGTIAALMGQVLLPEDPDETLARIHEELTTLRKVAEQQQLVIDELHQLQVSQHAAITELRDRSQPSVETVTTCDDSSSEPSRPEGPPTR